MMRNNETSWTNRVNIFRWNICVAVYTLIGLFPQACTHLKELELHDLSNRILGREPTAHVRPREEAPEPLLRTGK